MPAINIILDGDNAWDDLQGKEIIHLQDVVWEMAALPGGMSSGKPSVALRLDLPDGKVLVAETSLLALLSAVNAFVARHGDPR